VNPHVALEQFQRLLAEQLSASERQALEAHVDLCVECQQTLARLLDETPDDVLDVDWRLLRRGSSESTLLVTADFLRRLEERLQTGIPRASDAPEERLPCPIHFPGPPTDRGPLGQLESYHIVAELGRGASGYVFQAYDEQLDCLVALKVLKPELAASASDRARFEREARAAAAVRHDHVVAIHRVGNTPDFALPYLVMEYLDGEPLSEWLQRQGVRIPREAAEVARQVALGLAAAHARGLVHRDIKPSNIVLESSTGRAKITDFGLARPVQVGPNKLTQSGAMVGTPPYMSPEQIVTPLQVDARSDVYSLGVVLYEVLTGETPFRGPTHWILQQIVTNEPVPPSRLQKVPRDLETITLKCLAKEPNQRYQTAQELADDLHRFLIGEPIRARPVSRVERLWRWSRRHKLLVTSVGTLLLAVLLLVGAGLWWWQGQRVAVEGNLREAEHLLEQERWPEAVQVLERASGRLTGGGPASLRDRVEALRRDVELVYRLEEARLLASAWTGLTFNFAGADQAYREAFAKQDLDLSKLTREEAAEQIRASAIRTHLIAALDNWADVKDQLHAESEEPLRVVARLADDDPWRQQLRDPKVRRDLRELVRLAREESAQDQPPANLVLLGRALKQANGRAMAVALLRRAQQRHPADFWINFDLANLLFSGPAAKADAVAYFRAALALRPQDPAVHHNLGNALKTQENREKLAEAVDAFRKAIELNPDFAAVYGTYGSLATALREQGKLAEAVHFFEKASELNPDFAWVHHNFGVALLEQGKLEEAADEFRKAIALQPDLAGAHNSLGDALRRLGKLAEAEEAFRKSSAIKPDPAGPDPAGAYGILGAALVNLTRPVEAEEVLRKGLAIEPDRAGLHLQLGNALRQQGKFKEAMEAFRLAISFNPDLAWAHYNLGVVLQEQRKLAESMEAYRNALALQPGLTGFDRAGAQCNLGKLLIQQGHFADAVIQLRQGHELGSRDPHWPHESAQWLRKAEGLSDLDVKLTQVLNEQTQVADAAERLELGWLCLAHRQRYVTASRFYEQAFTDQPALAKPVYRYNAACAAALAGCGQGKDAGAVGDEERTRLRWLALTWLRAELEAWRQELDKDSEKARSGAILNSTAWLGDGDFAGVHDPEALNRLTETERTEWQKFWKEVVALRQRAAEPAKPMASDHP
jgi:tetratricopeptide (TPR) repeat protein/tRNA A-37 threonylcarbamoyl transferase component Bud32